MENQSSEQFVNRMESFVPNVSMDCVVFGYRNEALHVLLLKYRNLEAWALPGGFLSEEEEMEDAVDRVLMERTGLSNIFLSQFHTFSSLSRGWQNDDFSRSVLQSLFSATSDDQVNKLKHWFEQRFISTGYLALVTADDAKPTPDYLSDHCTWIPVNDLPPLVLDHQNIVEKALKHLKVRVNFL
ncbi:MAG: NUDIX domain-containing protein, partial [Cyclobacteriaceae bacterium]